jgi:hypothetical protein
MASMRQVEVLPLPFIRQKTRSADESQMESKSALPTVSIMERYRFAILLAAQLGLLVTVPVVDIVGTGLTPVAIRLTIGIGFIVLVLFTLAAVGDTRNIRWAIFLIGIPAVLIELADIVRPGQFVHGASHVISVLFFALVVIAIIRYIFRSDRVDANVLFAALCVYVMLGMLFAYAYAAIESVMPGSFQMGQGNLAERVPLDIGGRASNPAFYFSYVTMTTLGYGDIYPVSPIAKMTASLQAVLGQLYLAVLVARLVGLHIAHSQAGGGQSGERAGW